MFCSLIIPAYNEAERIGHSLEKAIAYLADQEYSSEILVVDDGSRDTTTNVVETYCGDTVRLLRQPRNMGKGAAVRRGMLEALGQYRIFTDADFSTPVKEVSRALEVLRSYDVCVGSRAIDASYIKEHQPWYRESMGKVFNLLVQMVAVPGVHDTQCGFKGFRAPAAKEIFSRAKIDGFGFDVEVLYLARRLGYTLKEIPVEWYNDPRTTLSPVTDSIRMFNELLRVRGLHRTLEPVRSAEMVEEPKGLPLA